MRVLLMMALPATLAIAFAAAGQPTPLPAPGRLPAGLDTRDIETGADPCTSFFAYACGNFGKRYPIPADRSEYGTFAIVFDHTESVLHELLDKVARPDPKRTANEQKIGDYYATCMNTAAIDKKGMLVFESELDRIAALTSKSDLPELLGRYQLLGVGAFFNVSEQQDFKDATKQIAVVAQAGLGLPEREYYLRTGKRYQELRQEYVKLITNVMRLLGETDTRASHDAASILDLETALARLSMDVTTMRDPQKVYHLMSMEVATKLMPSLPLRAILGAAQFPVVSQINVTNPDFLKGVSSLIDSTDVAALQAYLRWQLIASTSAVAMPKPLDDEFFAFYGRTFSGQPKQRERWKLCVDATDQALGEALGEVYVAHEFPRANKQATLQMVHDIEDALNSEIERLDWMSPTTKAKAKTKLRSVAEKIGYPDHFRDYSNLSVQRGDAYGNARRAVMFERLRQIDKIGKPVDRGEWLETAATVDAYYDKSMNDINFPAAILQSPLFDANATDAVNYGHIGSIVGHELTHGFDDRGRRFDANGNLADWWTAADAKKFDEKEQCVVDEYNDFIAVDDLHINGKLTLGENTADNGGLRLAYQAFLTDAKRKHIDVTRKQADGFTPIQEFFIGYGQDFCGGMRPKQLRVQVETDPHSPSQFRVDGVVRNMPEFATAFGCKLGQPMMPKKVCRVW